jgi:hypothetical protein
MTPRQLHRFLIAPEIIVVDLSIAVLAALERALRAEHPLLDASPSDDDPSARRRARDVVDAARHLRHALRRYQHLVRVVVREALAPDLPPL